jgi:hypothetical protein
VGHQADKQYLDNRENNKNEQEYSHGEKIQNFNTEMGRYKQSNGMAEKQNQRNQNSPQQ